MLVKKGEANRMYCPFKFSKPASKELGQINPEWICERRPRLYGMAKNRGIEMGWRTWLLWVIGKTARY